MSHNMKKKNNNNQRAKAKGRPALSTNASVAIEVVNTTVTVTLPYPGRSPKLLVLLNDHKFDSSSIEADDAKTVVTVSRKFTSSGFAAGAGKALAEDFGCSYSVAKSRGK